MLASTISNEWAYVGITWGATAAVIGGYAVMVLRRGRRLSREVPDDQRLWM